MYSEIFTGDRTDKRFYGIYRGVVIDNKDPENKNRVRLKVPQILGNAVTGWAWPITGTTIQGKIPALAVSDYTTQYAGGATTLAGAVANQAAAIRIGQIDFSSNIELIDGGKLRVKNSGIYNFQWSGQFSNIHTTHEDASIWIRINNVDVVGSSGLVSVPAKHGSTRGHTIAGWNFVLQLNAGDTLELWWYASTVDIQLNTYPSTALPTSPSTASVVATLTAVSEYIPNPTDGCWVMFEGGDPNFPLWLGAF